MIILDIFFILNSQIKKNCHLLRMTHSLTFVDAACYCCLGVLCVRRCCFENLQAVCYINIGVVYKHTYIYRKMSKRKIPCIVSDWRRENIFLYLKISVV